MKPPKVLPVRIVEVSYETSGGGCGLKRTMVGYKGSEGDQSVEEGAKCSETCDSSGYRVVYIEEVSGKGTTEEKESSLEHEWRTSHEEIEKPGMFDHLASPVSTAIDE